MRRRGENLSARYGFALSNFILLTVAVSSNAYSADQCLPKAEIENAPTGLTNAINDYCADQNPNEDTLLDASKQSSPYLVSMVSIEKDKNEISKTKLTEMAEVQDPYSDGTDLNSTTAIDANRINYQKISGGSDTKWHLSGYADATFLATKTEGEDGKSSSTARFNPAFHFQYKNLILFEAESEISLTEDGETEFELEYAQADIFVHDNATLVLGQFLSPVGQFQERLHPTWINRMGNAPAGFGHDGVQPASEIGAMVRGGISLGSMIGTYSLAIGNGPRISHEGGVVFEASGGDDNSNKAFSGRLGLQPIPYFEFGGSFLTGKVTGEDSEETGEPDEHGLVLSRLKPIANLDEHDEHDELSPSEANVSLWGADAAYTRGPWDVRVEYLNVDRDPISTTFEGSDGVELLPSLGLEAWYAQIAYRLSGVTDNKTLQRFEPVIRYGEYKVEGLEELAEEAAEERFDAGLNYWIAPSIVVRAVFEKRTFTARHDDDPTSEKRYLMQLSYGF